MKLPDQFPRQTVRILLKVGFLFFVFNYAFALVPNSFLWKISLYNTILPGKPRFPQEDDLDLLFSVHEIDSSLAKADDEFNVVILGDSATWGYLLDPQETFAGIINSQKLKTCDGKPIHLYNLGYPRLSVFKDLLIFERAAQYQPDAVLWMVTLKSMFQNEEEHVIINYNAESAKRLMARYALSVELSSDEKTLFERTFLKRRSEIARFIRFQLDDIRIFIEGEHTSPPYTSRGQDVKADLDFEGLLPPVLDSDLLMSSVINAGKDAAGETIFLVVNQPIQMVTGENSETRYNHHYPRWAYDQYRSLMDGFAQEYNWQYVDLWDVVPPTDFSDSAIHRNETGEKVFAAEIIRLLNEISCP